MQRINSIQHRRKPPPWSSNTSCWTPGDRERWRARQMDESRPARVCREDLSCVQEYSRRGAVFLPVAGVGVKIRRISGRPPGTLLVVVPVSRRGAQFELGRPDRVPRPMCCACLCLVRPHERVSSSPFHVNNDWNGCSFSPTRGGIVAAPTTRGAATRTKRARHQFNCCPTTASQIAVGR